MIGMNNGYDDGDHCHGLVVHGDGSVERCEFTRSEHPSACSFLCAVDCAQGTSECEPPGGRLAQVPLAYLTFDRK
jgi:hypothetical protein